MRCAHKYRDLASGHFRLTYTHFAPVVSLEKVVGASNRNAYGCRIYVTDQVYSKHEKSTISPKGIWTPLS
jgi:hypothetical protein